MAIASISVDITLKHEGSPDYGINDTLKAEYRRTLSQAKLFEFNKKTQKDKAIDAMTWAFENKGFSNYEDQEVANFLFDTYIHLKVMYFILVTYLTGNQESIKRVLHTFVLPTNVYDEINAYCKDEDAKKLFLAQCKFYRRRMERCYPRWAEKSEPQKSKTYLTAFDKRVFSFPYTMACEPSEIYELYLFARKMSYWVAWSYYKKKPSVDFLEKFVFKNIEYNLDVVATGIWGKKAFIDINSCKAANIIRVKNTTQANNRNYSWLLWATTAYGVYRILK